MNNCLTHPKSPKNILQEFGNGTHPLLGAFESRIEKGIFSLIASGLLSDNPDDEQDAANYLLHSVVIRAAHPEICEPYLEMAATYISDDSRNALLRSIMTVTIAGACKNRFSEYSPVYDPRNARLTEQEIDSLLKIGQSAGIDDMAKCNLIELLHRGVGQMTDGQKKAFKILLQKLNAATAR